MTFTSALAHCFSILFSLFMARNLSLSNFGVVTTLFAMMMLVSASFGPIQTVATKFVSSFYAQGHLAKIKHLLFKLGKRISLFGLLLFFAFTFGSRIIAAFFQIGSSHFVIATGAIMFFSLVLPFSYGALQGFQRFGFLSINIILSGALKLLVGVFLITAGLEVGGVLTAVGLATFIPLILSLFMLRSALESPPDLSESGPPVNPGDFIPDKEIAENKELNFSKVYKYFIPVSITFLCFTALTNFDILLVKRFFSPVEAGYYSIAQLVGKIMLFWPAAIIMVMFTKVSYLHARGKDTISMLKKTLMIVGVPCAIGALICFLFPSVIIRILSGKAYVECFPLARLFGIAMTFFSLTYTLLLYNLSIHRFNFIRPLIFFSVSQIILICFFHRTLPQVLYIITPNSSLLFIYNLFLIKKPVVPR